MMSVLYTLSQDWHSLFKEVSHTHDFFTLSLVVLTRFLVILAPV